MFAGLVLFPLFFSIFLTINNELMPKKLINIGILGYLVSIIISFYLLLNTCIFNYSGKFIIVYQFFNWSTIEGVDLGLNLWFDYVSIIMCFTVILIAGMVNLFSIYYMANDSNILRFFSYLSLFTFCMLVLVTAADLLQFFIGWELVGLCSYLLINFWYTRKQANVAATKAVLVNRVGDFSFLFGMALLFTKVGSLNIYDLSWLVITDIFYFLNFNFITVLMFIAVMSKSAQIGLHMWLPDAMEGPTPVSALIHAATMVTAGIFLMIRLSCLFVISEDVMFFITIVGAITSFFGATTGVAQTDIKKIIAFSTCSQLGYMVTACGLGYFNYAFFHLITHAFFKSLLFLSAGVIIHTLGGEQDIRKMGGLQKILPIPLVSIAVASFALSGMPYLSGYYSKELIICIALLQHTWLGFFSATLLIFSAFFTSLYSAKLLYFVFFTKPKIKIIDGGTHTVRFGSLKYYQDIPLIILSIFSIFGGFFLKNSVVGIGSNTLLNPFGEFSIKNTDSLWVEFLPLGIKLCLFLVGVSGYLIYFLSYKNILNLNYIFNKNKTMRKVYSFFYNRWYLDFLISYFFNYFILLTWEESNIYFIQSKLVDLFTVKIALNTVKTTSGVFSLITTANPQQYLKLTIISVVLILTFGSVCSDTTLLINI